MITEKQLKIAKGVAGLVVRRSVSFVAASAIANLVPTEGKIQKIELVIGASVIGGIVADKAVDYAHKTFDNAVLATVKLASAFNEEPVNQ